MFHDEVIDTPQSDGELARLAQLAEQQVAAEQAVALAEQALEIAKSKLRSIAEQQIPELMAAIGLDSVVTANGLKVKVEEKVRASIPKDRHAEAFAWLRERKHEAIVKREISVQFSANDNANADQLYQKLIDLGYEAEDWKNVHPSTLSSFVRGQLEAGVAIPMDLFGIFVQKSAKITTK